MRGDDLRMNAGSAVSLDLNALRAAGVDSFESLLEFLSRKNTHLQVRPGGPHNGGGPDVPALPPDVRRWLRPAGKFQETLGLCLFWAVAPLAQWVAVR